MLRLSESLKNSTNPFQFLYVPVRLSCDEQIILEMVAIVKLAPRSDHQNLVAAATFKITAVMPGPVTFFWAVLGHSLGFKKRSLTVGMVKKETRKISTTYRDDISLLLSTNIYATVGYEVIKKTTNRS